MAVGYLWQCLHHGVQQGSHPYSHLQQLQHCGKHVGNMVTAVLARRHKLSPSPRSHRLQEEKCEIMSTVLHQLLSSLAFLQCSWLLGYYQNSMNSSITQPEMWRKRYRSPWLFPSPRYLCWTHLLPPVIMSRYFPSPGTTFPLPQVTHFHM